MNSKINSFVGSGLKLGENELLLTVHDSLHMLQTDCGVWVDAVLDLKEHRQVVLQKSFIVPFMSTAAMMRSRGRDIALTEEGGEMMNSLNSL